MENYYALLKKRLRKFNLELEESKSRLIEFARYAETTPSVNMVESQKHSTFSDSHSTVEEERRREISV